MPTVDEQNTLAKALANIGQLDTHMQTARKEHQIQKLRQKQRKESFKQKTIPEYWYEVYAHCTYISDKTKPVDPVTGKYPDRPNQGFVSLGGLIKYPDFLKDPENKIFTDKASHKKIVEIDNIPHYWSNPSWLLALKGCTNLVRFVNQLLQNFRPEVLERAFPDVMLKIRNAQAQEAVRKERAEYRRAQRKIPKKDRQLHAEVRKLTQNKSAASFQREYRNLAR